MLICGIDFETTSSDPLEARPIEVGLILWDDSWNEKSRFSTLMWGKNYPELSDEIVKVTGITDHDIKKEAIPTDLAFKRLNQFIDQADMLIAHNAQYDFTVYKKESDRLGFIPWEKPWHCSIQDIQHPESMTCRKLSHLALDYGIAIDPATLHRALRDVELMGDVLRKAKISPQEISKFASSPWVYLKACIPAPWTDNGRGKELAKKDGYSWEKARGTDSPVFEKQWIKRVKQCNLDVEKARQVGFKREVITP